MIADELIIKVMADTRDAVVNLTKMTGEAGKAKTAGIDLQNAFAKMRDIMQGPVAMFQQATRVLGDLWNISQEFFDAYASGEQTIVQFNHAMETSDRLYKGAGDRIEAHIQLIKEETYYGDDLLRQQAALLASYGRTEEEIKKIITVATDMSAMTGESLPDSINKLNMTLNGNIGRMGMTYGEIKKLTAEQLAAGEAIDILAGKFDGGAKKMSQSAAGMKKDLQDAFEDMKENFGEFIAQFENPALKATLDFAKQRLQAEAFGKVLEAIRKREFEYLTSNKATSLQILDAQLSMVEAATKGNVEKIKELQLVKERAEREGDFDKLRASRIEYDHEFVRYEGILRQYGIDSHSTYVQLLSTRRTLLEMSEKEAQIAKEQAAAAAAAAEAEAEAAAAAAAKAEEDALSKKIWEETEAIMSRVVDYEHDRADVHKYIERAMMGAYEEAEKIADTMEEINAPGGGAVGTVNNLAEAYQNLQKAMGGGMVAAPILTADKILQPGGNNPQFDWKSTGGDQWDMYASPQVDAINAGMAELAIQRQLDDILGDKATKAREIVGLYRQAEQIESIAAQTAREKAEAEKAFADWQKQWIDQLGSTGIDILMEAAHALDVARAVGWEEAAKGFDQYMVRLIDQLPMMLLTAGLQVIGVNFPVGLALIIASGLVAIADAVTTSAAEQAAYSSSTAGSGSGSGGGGGITINQYVQGSIWERRALEATAVRAAEKAGRGW